jgi:hypothetical protein
MIIEARVQVLPDDSFVLSEDLRLVTAPQQYLRICNEYTRSGLTPEISFRA